MKTMTRKKKKKKKKKRKYFEANHKHTGTQQAMVFSRNSILIFGLLLAGPWIWVLWKTSTPTRMLQTVDISIGFDKQSEQFNFPDLVDATQIQIDAELPYVTNRSIAVNFLDNLRGDIPKERTNYSVELVLSRDNSLAVSPDGLTAYVFYSYESIQSNDLPYLITQTILYHLLKSEVA